MADSTVEGGVLIVGAGPAGLAAALSAVHHQPRIADQITVLEAKRFPRHKPCGGGLTRSALLTLTSLGLRPRVPLTAVRRLTVRSPRGTFAFERERPYFVVADRTRFDAWLAEEARSAGISVVEDARALEVGKFEGGFHVRTEAVVYRTPVLVGADGANSLVRRSLCPAEEPLARLLEIRGDLGLDEQTAVFDFSLLSRGLPGYRWTFPYRDAERGVLANIGVYDSRGRSSGARESLPDLLSAYLGDESWASVRTRFETASHPIRRWRGVPSMPDGLLLIGDALGVDGLLGEGISVALNHGVLAGHALATTREREPRSITARFSEDVLADAQTQLLRRRETAARWAYGRAGSLGVDLALRAAQRLDRSRARPGN